MKKVIGLFLFWSFSLPVFAQNYQQAIIDSLKKELSISKIDTSNVLTMVKLADQYKFSNVDSSLFYGQKALEASRKIKFHEGEYKSLFIMGYALSMAGNSTRALELELKALRITEKYNFTIGRGQILNRLGIIYRSAGDFSSALFYHKQSKQFFDSSHNYKMAVPAEVYLGMAYYRLNELDSALFYSLRADKNIKRYGDEIMSCPNLITLGRIQTVKGNVQPALNYFQQSLSAGYLIDQYFFTSTANIEIAEIYQQAGQPDSCIYYAQRALDDAQKNGNGLSIAEVSIFLSSLYEKSNLELALRYHKMAVAALKKINNLYNLNAIQNLMAFDEEERQFEISTAQAAYQNQVRQYALLTGLGVFLLIAFFLYRNNRQKQKTNALLHHQKEEVNAQKIIAEKTLSELKSTQLQLIQSEKMASLGELTAGIAHEIQNPLNFVNNFSEVNEELVKELNTEAEKGNLEEVKAIAKDIQFNSEKINHHGKRADAIVKGMLQHSRTNSGQKETTDVNALAEEYLRLSYHGLRAKDKSFNATMKTDFDHSMEKINIIPQDIGRVVLNLINNAFYAVDEKKKAAVENYEPTVSVSTKKNNGKVEIRVRDNGNGIPQKVLDKIFQPFFTTKPTGQGTGLGLSLSYDIVKAHGGELKVETKEKAGSIFIILLPAS
ncbi:MAG: tetratricopeptide repeat protein [Bacteroidetes bacterium]|nr:MAG: tetratricopeptide repeat protein [Bacteroidota bacterium]